ncbi:unnamed protein product, partial [Ectocarpus fasciculatus]
MVSALAFSFAFVGQRAAMLGGIGPMTFNAARYVLSGIMLLIAAPMLPYTAKVKVDKQHTSQGKPRTSSDELAETGLLPLADVVDMTEHSPLSENATMWIFGLTLGLLNFIASTSQQIGLQYTSAGKCAFITGFDIAFVPIVGLMIPQLTSDAPPKMTTWISVCISVLGLYLISSSDADGGSSPVGMGEIFIFVGTIFWTFHIVVTDIATNHVDSVSLTLVQFLGTSVLCVFSSLFFESGEWSVSHIFDSWQVILLLGVCECLGFTLAAMGQTHAPPSHAVIIMSFEAVFTAVVGYMFLHETLSSREFFGCFLMVISFICIRWDM